MLWSHWINWDKTWLSQPELDDYQHQARSLQHVGAFQYAVVQPDRQRRAAARPRRDGAAAGVRRARRSADRRPPVHRRRGSPGPRSRGRARRRFVAIAVWRRPRRSSAASISLDDDALHRARRAAGVAAGCRSTTRRRQHTQLWVPLALGPNDPQQRGNHGLFALGRLAPGATLDAGAGGDRHDHARFPDTIYPASTIANSA